ncbi:MAG TPA: alpha/beta fold hydrolase [Verrucomicrobiae bacterium]|nr:alpha/beta fold hydrolase [Verrucomicrobiae bacterium]
MISSHSHPFRSNGRFFGGLAGMVLLLIAPGCGMSRLAANRIIAAPNQHQRGALAAWNSVWTNLLSKVTTNPLVSVTIPVGPPEAALSAMEVPPRDYHSRFVTSVERKPNGKGTLSLRWEPEPRDTFQPLENPATILVLHGYGMMKESMAPWAFVLAQAGFRVVTVDLRGHGQSTGAQITFGKYETTDLRQVLDYLIAHGLCDERVGVLGLSYGATLALNWAARDPRVRGVVAIAPYNRPDDAIARFAEMEKAPVPRRLVRAAAVSAGAKLDLKWSEWSAEAAMRRLKQPVLLIGGGKDPLSRPEDILKLKQAAGGESQSLEVPEADHYVVGFWIQDLAGPITAWFRERL